MRVVKLGGSLAHWHGLRDCLDRLAVLGVVIVPGGGPFADQVRSAQRYWRFDDTTAHEMALWAMCQYGRMLAGIDSRVRAASTVSELRNLVHSGLTAVWLPRPETFEASDVAATWDITADSLAAWIASQLAATDLILLKSASCPAVCATVAALEAEGIVDRAFGRFLVGAAFSTWICHRDDYRCISPDRGTNGGPMLRVAA